MINKNTFCFVALTVITTVTLPAYIWAAVPGNLLENGSFEVYEKDPSTWSIAGRVDFSLGIGNTDIIGWTVIQGEVDYFGLCPDNPPKIWRADDGENSIELAASPSAGGVSQTFATTAGETYRVQFYMSGSPMTGWSGEDQPIKTVRARAAGRAADFSFDMTVRQNTLEDMKWKLCTFFFIAESDSTTLEIFSTMEPVHIGPVIDNVSVVDVSNWSPAGTYMGTNAPWEEKILITVTPLDTHNQRFSIVSDGINTANKSRLTARGELVRTGPDTFDGTQVAYIIDEDYELTMKVIVSGTIVQTSADSLEAAWVAAAYGGDQDPLAEGAVPLMSFPATAWYQRAPIVPPYIPPEGRQ
jgi:choice-of-anchor C domain-containing protein